MRSQRERFDGGGENFDTENANGKLAGGTPALRKSKAAIPQKRSGSYKVKRKSTGRIARLRRAYATMPSTP